MIRYISSAIAIAAAFTLTAAAPQQSRAEREEAQLTKTLNGLTPGKPVSCVPMDRVNDVKGYQATILYVAGKNKLWRNETSGGCEGLGERDDIMVTRTTTRQYCRGDIVETRSRTGGHYTGSCSLGDFVPYSKTN